MSVAKKQRISPETTQEKLEDARILFLWKVKEASKSYHITIVSVFGDSCGETNLKKFSDAVEDLSTQYVNDVKSLNNAFSVKISFPDSDRTAISETSSIDTPINTVIEQPEISTSESTAIETPVNTTSEPSEIYTTESTAIDTQENTVLEQPEIYTTESTTIDTPVNAAIEQPEIYTTESTTIDTPVNIAIEQPEISTKENDMQIKEEAEPETLNATDETTALPKEETAEGQDQTVSYIIDGAASNEYIQNIEFEDGDYGGQSVMYLTLASDDQGVIGYKDGTGTAATAIKYIQTQDQQGNIIYTQADEAHVPAENAQITETGGNIQHVEYIQGPDTAGTEAYASGDEPMVIEYSTEATETPNVIEYADALKAGIQYAEVESLPNEIREIENIDFAIKQEAGSVPISYSDSMGLQTTVTSSDLIEPKQEFSAKNRTGPSKKKFNPAERSLLDQLDIKDVVCTIADEEQAQTAEEKDLAKAQLLGETENVADLEFTIAPKFPKMRKRKALQPGETKGMVCDLCGDVLYTQNALTKHKNRMHPEHSEHICCLCYKFCSNKKDLRSHFYNAHNKEELCTCPVCGFSYRTHTDFKYHLKACTFTPEDLGYKKPVFVKKPVKGAHLPFKCKFCSMGFVRKGTLTHHIVVKHLKYTPGSSNSCEVCEKRYLHEYSLIKHHRTKEHIKKVKEAYGSQSDGEEEDVNQAAHGFTNITVAPVIKKRGTREQNSLFICYICGKDFNRESSLNIHIAKHKKAFVCEICNHRLDSRSQLVIHRRIHTGESPFVCDLCGKGLRSNKHLYQHKKQMHSDVAFKCTHCGSVFKQLSSLYQHIRKKHGEDAYEKFKKEGARSKLVPLAHSGINQ